MLSAEAVSPHRLVNTHEYLEEPDHAPKKDHNVKFSGLCKKIEADRVKQEACDESVLDPSPL